MMQNPEPVIYFDSQLVGGCIVPMNGAAGSHRPSCDFSKLTNFFRKFHFWEKHLN